MKNSGIKTGQLKYDNASGGYPPVLAAPTATAAPESASVAFTTTAVATSYTVLSTPGSITATGTNSPITVTGLTGGTSYTFQVRAVNSTGNGPYSAASNSVTPTSYGFEQIAIASGTGSSSSITFSSIPSGYKHLQIRFTGKSTGTSSTSSANCWVRFNSDTGTNYQYQTYTGNGATISTDRGSGKTEIIVSSIILSSNAAFASMMGNGIIDIVDYSDTNKYKVIKVLGGFDTNLTTGVVGRTLGGGGIWSSTSAITSIQLETSTGSWATSSQFALYGIKGA